MNHFELMVLLFVLGVAGQYKTTAYAESIGVENNKTQTTVIEHNKNITVKSGINVDETLATLNVTDASNIPRVRKVSHVDNDSLERKPKAEVSAKEEKRVNTTTTATIQSLNVTRISTEAGLLDIKTPTKLENIEKKTSSPTQNIINIKKDNLDLSNSTAKNEVKKQDKNNNSSTNLTIKEPETSTAIIPKANSTVLVETNLTLTNKSGALLNSTGSSKLTNSTSSTTSTTTTSTTTTTTTTSTTTTTTTPKPKKPTITYSTHDFPDLEKDNPEYNSLHSSASNKVPVPDVPYTQPSQELNSSNFRRGRDFILPIVSMIFIIPLVIGILITSYRRFRDCWSTRHYRRMDFLVDGMYND